MRLVDADEIKKRERDVVLANGAKHRCFDTTMLYEIPTVDAEPVKHGHWIEVQRIHEKDHTAICECSLCGDTVWVYDGQRAWNYCPNCGAKNEVEE